MTLMIPLLRLSSPIDAWEILQRAVSSLLLFTGLVCTNAAIADTSGALIPLKSIPHSEVSEAEGKGVVKATLACATDRYAHGVLGDYIEAGCLVLEDHEARRSLIELPDTQVFEDLEARIVDFNDDGYNDVVVVRSERQSGAALVIYQMLDGKASVLAATPPIGRSNRWLAPIGAADFNGDGHTDIAYVQTPHIGGILKIWSITDAGFEQIGEQSGFSNHSIGSTRVSTARIVDHNKDGLVDIALPDQRRAQIVWLSFSPELGVIDKQPYSEAYFKQ